MTNSRKASLWRLFKQYQYDAKRKKRIWELGLEEFEELTSRPCFYCSKPPTQSARAYLYNGLDRKCNLKGYTLSNVVACCALCNRIKGADITHEEMIVLAKALGDLRRIFFWA